MAENAASDPMADPEAGPIAEGEDELNKQAGEEKTSSTKADEGELKQTAAKGDAPKFNNYGAIKKNKPYSGRWMWRPDGQTLRQKVWGHIEVKPGEELPPSGDKEHRLQRTLLHYQKKKDDDVDKSCIADCWLSCYNFYHKIKDFNPFFASEIALVSRKFGAGIAHFFLLWRWLLTLNFLIFIWWFVWVILPWFDVFPTFVDSDPPNAKWYNRDDLGWRLLVGQGSAAMQSFMFYSGFVPYPNMGSKYRIGAVWVFCVLCSVLVSFGCLMARRLSRVLHSTSDAGVESKMKKVAKCDRKVAELLFSDLDWGLTDKETNEQQINQWMMSTNTLLDEEFANIGAVLYFPSEKGDVYEFKRIESASGELILDIENDSIQKAAFNLQNEHEYRRSILGQEDDDTTKGVASQAVAVFVAEGGYEDYQKFLNIDQHIDDNAAEIATLEAAIEKAEAAPAKQVDEEMGNLVDTDAESQPTAEELKVQKVAKEQEKAALEKFKNDPPPSLQRRHHQSSPKGVLMRNSAYRVPCIRHHQTGAIMEVFPFEMKRCKKPLWEKLKEVEAAEIMGKLKGNADQDAKDAHAAEAGEDAVKLDPNFSAEHRGKNIDALIGEMLTDAGHTQQLSLRPSLTKPSYDTIGTISKYRIGERSGRRQQDTVWAQRGDVLAPETAKLISEMKGRDKKLVHRYVWGVLHEDTSEIAENEGCCNLSCFGRFVSLSTTVLLIIATAAAFGLTSAYEEELVDFFWGLNSAPTLVLTVIKTIIPLVVTALVACEKYDRAEKVLSETIWRVFAIKMIALFYFAYNLQNSVDTPDTSLGFTQCAAARIGMTYFNLVFVNAIVSMLTNTATYIGLYLINGERTQYDHNVVALAYIELFYTQGVLWLGTPWSPVLPFVWVILASADCAILVFIMDKFCKPSDKTFSGGSSQDLIENNLMITFIITVVPTMWFLNGSPSTGMACAVGAATNTTGCTEYLPCGPIAADHTHRFKALTDYVDNELLAKIDILQKIFEYGTQPMVAYLALLVIIAFCVVQQCILNKVRTEAASVYDELLVTKEDKEMLAKEGKESFDFQQSLLGDESDE